MFEEYKISITLIAYKTVALIWDSNTLGDRNEHLNLTPI